MSGGADTVAALHTGFVSREVAAAALGGRTESGLADQATTRALDKKRARRGFVWSHLLCLFFFTPRLLPGAPYVPQSSQCLMLL